MKVAVAFSLQVHVQGFWSNNYYSLQKKILKIILHIIYRGIFKLWFADFFIITKLRGLSLRSYLPPLLALSSPPNEGR